MLQSQGNGIRQQLDDQVCEKQQESEKKTSEIL
jgi:hypothetical protein